LKSFRFFLAPAATQGIQITVFLKHRFFPHTGDLFQRLQDPLIDAQIVLFRPELDPLIQFRISTANGNGFHGRPPDAEYDVILMTRNDCRLVNSFFDPGIWALWVDSSLRIESKGRKDHASATPS